MQTICQQPNDREVEGAFEHELVTVPSSRRWPRLLRLVLAEFVLLCAIAVAEASPARGPSTTVQPGDSWASVRNRLFPLDSLQKANPGLDPQMLHPGEVVRAPYVPAGAFERERAARQAAESRFAESERDRASLEARGREVSRAEGLLVSLRAAVIGLLLVVIVLLALLSRVAKAMRAARRSAAEIGSRHRVVQSRYEELCRALHDIDVRLQQRVVSLLRLHGGKIVSDTEITTSIAPLLDSTQELKKKHERDKATDAPRARS